jgi:hypothetical protein
VTDDLTVERSPGLLSPEYRLVTIAILLIVSLAAFDALSVYAALPAIGGDLGHVALLPWVMTSFLLASAIAILASGPLIDGLGARATFRGAVLIFFVSSAACAVSPGMWALIVARFAQGMGGGISVAVGLASIGLTYPERLHARVRRRVVGVVARRLWWSACCGVVGGHHRMARRVHRQSPACRNRRRVRLESRADHHRLGHSTCRLDRRGIAIVAVFTSALLVGLSHLGWSTFAYLALAAPCSRLPAPHAQRTTLVVEGRHLWRSRSARSTLTVLLSLAACLGVESFLPSMPAARKDAAKPSPRSSSCSSPSAGPSAQSPPAACSNSSAHRRRVLDDRRAGAGDRAHRLRSCTPTASSPSERATSSPVVHRCDHHVRAHVVAGLRHVRESGRINAAHQYMRTVGISAGIALSGAWCLFVVGQRVGNVESVRQLLAGDRLRWTIAPPSRSARAMDGRTQSARRWRRGAGTGVVPAPRVKACASW